MAKDGFLRISNALFAALLRLDLTGTQWSIVLWTLRNTIGWNRETARFSWYRIAKELSMDRGGIARAGSKLLGANVLFLRDGQLGIQTDHREWDRRAFRCPYDDARQLWMPGVWDDQRHRKPMTGDIASDDEGHRNRCPESSLFRRTKDNGKDRLKTYKDRHPRTTDDARQQLCTTHQRRHLEGAAKPIPGKYDGLS